MLTKRKLEILLSKVKDFKSPKPSLEQYITPSHIAADLLWFAFMNGDIEDKVVIDLGAGTGTLSIGAFLLGARKVIAVESDEEAAEIGKKNCEEFGADVTWIISDVRNFEGKGDTVVMNPPFGIQKRHQDRIFIKKALECAPVVYSILKGGNDEFLYRFVSSLNAKAEKISEFAIPLKATMKFHEKRKYEVFASLWRFYKEVKND